MAASGPLSKTALQFALLLVIGGLAYLAFLKPKRQSKTIGWRPIPQPRSFPIVGNLPQLDLKEPLASLNELGTKYRDVFRMKLPGVSLVIINSQRLYDEVCNVKNFHKEPVGALLEARNGIRNGLFTAWTHEKNWEVAHRVLSPLFGQLAVKQFVGGMHDMTKILVETWSKLGPQDAITPYDEFAKFAFDTVGAVAFDIQFNAMQEKRLPQFASDLSFFLSESGKRAVRPSFVNNYLYKARSKPYWDAIDRLKSVGRQAVEKRKGIDRQKGDILDAMLNNQDPITGETMGEDSAIDNVISILGAASDSTASMLSWTLVMLIQHPRCLQIVRDEVAKVLNGRPIRPDDVDRLEYLDACIRETLRLYPSASAHGLKLREDADSTGLGEERYLVRREDTVRVNLLAIQRDPLVFGPDAEEFKPERMLDENFRKFPRNSWKPFGTGARICIGRFYAQQLACVVFATLVQEFDFKLVNDQCRLVIGKTLILRPDCAIQITKRTRSREPVTVRGL